MPVGIVFHKTHALTLDGVSQNDDRPFLVRDGSIQDEYSMATCSLLHGFEDGVLDEGQWIDGEIAFEVWPTSFYILEYESDKGNILRFRFEL